ncbi:MAG: Uncharacterized protein Athens101426_429 [Parcubacteria group bacterium Athens1014_26]|nr:MAG: Uncharacterized protein Athens101426_429 [Parcubacteria group bacterium Athens1014_26]
MLKPDYIIGLVDGEGSFTVYIRNPKDISNKRRVKAEPKFYVKLIEKDKTILYQLKNYFNCGNVYFQKDNRKNHQHCYRYEVANRKDLRGIIIPFFRNNRLKFPSKRKDFEIFCNLMKMIKAEKHLNLKGLKIMYQLKQKMH